MSGHPLWKTSARLRWALTLSLFAALAFLFTAALPFTSSATRGSAQLDGKRKRTQPDFVPGEALVRYRSESVAKKQTGQATLKAEGREMPIQVERFQGSGIVPGLRIARVAAEDTIAAIQALKKQPDVLYAEPNYLLHLDATPNDPRFTSNELYGLTKIGAPTAWNTTTGSTGPNAIVVGVVDEGIDISHQDLQNNIWTNPMPGSIPGITGDLHGYDFVNDSGTIPAEFHGTHVSGTIGAEGNNSTGVVGVNWRVGLMSLRFIEGSIGSTDDAISACAYAKQMRDLWVSSGGTKGANIRVLNNSYGGGGFTQSFLDTINGLDQSGILFVAAAGNVDGLTPEPNNELVPHYPSSYTAPNVIAVAWTDSNDNLSVRSHYGLSSVDLGAPGEAILSSTPFNNYSLASGTSMSSPHVAGAAALLLAANPNLTIQRLKSLLIYNGDLVPSLSGKTLTGRRLNVANSFQALAENDVTPPGTVTGLQVTSQSGRTINLGWTASGDDGANGQASLYELSFTDSISGAVVPLQDFAPPTSGTAETLSVKIPYGHTTGTITLREFDNVGNEGAPATLTVSVSFLDGNPYATALGAPSALSTGGTALLSNCDDCYKPVTLPFAFPFFGQSYSSILVSSNGNIYFEPSAAPRRGNGDADDVPSSSVDLARYKMISGLWDDLRTDRGVGDDIYLVTPDPTRAILRWQAVTFGDGTSATEFPTNFEIELQNNGTVKVRYGTGQGGRTNTGLFPVVGIAGGEPDPYVITSHTSELSQISLANALTVSFLPRIVQNPLLNVDFFVYQHYIDFLNRVPDASGIGYWTNEINQCGANAQCIEVKRINVSAAFYLSIEFQGTGYLVERLYKAAYGNAVGTSTFNGMHQFPVPIVRFEEFLPDTKQIGQGVVVGAPGWEQQLENNKVAFANDFVSRSRFTTAYPAMPASQFVDTLNANAGNPLSQSERDQLVNNLNGGLKTRAQVLRAVAEDPDLIASENTRAFVLMQYFGYLRRNPNSGPDSDHTGYDFWLTKLNQFNGNFIQAEMVKAFLSSDEYRHRFGP